MTSEVFIDAGHNCADLPKKEFGKVWIAGVRRPSLMRRLPEKDFDAIEHEQYAFLSRGVPTYYKIVAGPDKKDPWKIYIMPRPPGMVRLLIEDLNEEIIDDGISGTWQRSVSTG